jgi:long-chain fatty acid transport protein
MGLAVCAAPTAWAGGVEVLEQGRGVGNANAGVRATGDDASTVWWNPAAMTRLRRSSLALTGSVILPDGRFRDEGSFRAPTPMGPLPFTGGLGQTDDAIFTGAVFAVWSLNPCWKVGLGVNTPFGLTTNWGESWIGRYHATKSELLTVNINPSVAWKFHRNWSVAVGGSAMYAKATLGSALDLGAALGSPQSADGQVEMEGDSWGYGFNGGLLWEPTPCWGFGLHYRSRVKQDLEGDATYQVPAAAAPLVAATGRFVDTAATTSVTLPDTAGLSVVYRAGPQWSILADVTWTGWSSFEELDIDFANPAEPNNVTPWDWDDTWRVALGATYAPNRCWTFRGGVAWDQSPIPDSTRSPRIPGNDRVWFSAGAGYRFNRNVSVDLFYTHVFVERADSSRATVEAGALIGHYDSGVDVVGFQLNWDL